MNHTCATCKAPIDPLQHWQLNEAGEYVYLCRPCGDARYAAEQAAKPPLKHVPAQHNGSQRTEDVPNPWRGNPFYAVDAANGRPGFNETWRHR